MQQSLQLLAFCICTAGVALDTAPADDAYRHRSTLTKDNPLIFTEREMILTPAAGYLLKSANQQAVLCHATGVRNHIMCNPDTIRSGGFLYVMKYKLDENLCYGEKYKLDENLCYGDKDNINIDRCVLIVKSKWLPDFLSGLILTMITIGILSCFSCGISDQPMSRDITRGGTTVSVGGVLAAVALLGAFDGATANDSYAE